MDIKQDDILQLIRKQEAEIKRLQEIMKKPEPTIDVAIRARKQFIEELRAIM
jgi:protein involved in polysaccharide export with SLBB domain